jgi:3-deoxy-D-manno-octulosonic-acid transferase
MSWRLIDLLHALLALICYPLRFTQWGRERVRFEQARGPRIEAQWTFEVSSEGEFEQVRPWVQMILDRGEKIELIYASPSVEKTVTFLASHYPSQIRLFPLPLLTHTPWLLVRELSAPRLVMCRYDFFPSLMARASVAGVKAGVVWASFTNKRERFTKGPWRLFYRYLYSVFTWVVPATPTDVDLFDRLGNVRVLPYSEMRVPQIIKRLSVRQETLVNRFPHWEKFQALLRRAPCEQRWIMGSCWPEDLAFLKNAELQTQVKNGESLVMLVPHKLDGDWKALLAPYGMPVHVIDESWDGSDPGVGLVVLKLKGILCELYPEANFVYVGGGFGRSVHSVMEPFVGGARVVCGPKVSRSTEVELISKVSPQGIMVVADEAALECAYSNVQHDPPDYQRRQDWLAGQENRLLLNLVEVEKC